LALLFLLNVSQCVGDDPQPGTEGIALLILEKEKLIYAPVFLSYPIVIISLAALEILFFPTNISLNYSLLLLSVETLPSATCSSNSTCSCSQSFVPMS